MKGRAAPRSATGGVQIESPVDGTPSGPLSEILSEQNSLAKILVIWAAAVLPMGLLTRVIGPTIIPHTSRITPVVVPEGRLAR